MDIFAILFSCLKLLLVLGFCYAAGTSLLAARGERASPGLAVIWFTGGFCLVAFFFLFSKIAGSSLVFFVGLPALVAASLLIRKPALGISFDGGLAAPTSALALVTLTTIPVLIMGARMGAGEYPAEFFAGDSPFFLQQVYALMRTDSYPPPSLETYGFSFKYHYGFQAFVAITSILTGLKPHFVMFGVVQPMLELLAGLLVYDICRRLSGRHGAAMLCLALFLLGSRQYLLTFQPLDPSWWAFITHEENFNFRYPNGPDAAGLLMALCVIRCALEFERTNMRLAALFFTCLLAVFKLPYLIPVGAGIGLVYCNEMRKRFSVRLLFETGAAALLSVLAYMVFSQGPATAGGTAGLQFAGFLAMSMPWDNETLLILCAAVVATAAATRQRLTDNMFKLLLIAAAPYLLFCLWRLNVENEYQIFSLAVRGVALFAAAYLVTAWSADGQKPAGRRIVFSALIVALTLPGMLSLLNHVYVVSAHPEQGHEYADNHAVADALSHIPLQNTMIATNDLRYPANGYSREYRQFQLAGIFGHQNFGADLVYGGFRESERNRYANFLKLFQMETWNAALINILRQKVKITHLLIHKNFAHASEIPLLLIYENDSYRVYQF